MPQKKGEKNVSKPIVCRCGAFIGVAYPLAPALLPEEVSLFFRCPGRAPQHLKPVRDEESRFFGWLKIVTLDYPETGTSSTWCEFAGPRNLLALWLAFHLGARTTGPDRDRWVIVDGSLVWPRGLFGFTGEGLKELGLN